MVNPTDGGPAFPVHRDLNADETYFGMSLRDYFAGQALRNIMDADCDDCANDIATAAYFIADAMLRARVAQSPAAVQQAHIDEAFGR